jgi:hypothetical protein
LCLPKILPCGVFVSQWSVIFGQRASIRRKRYGWLFSFGVSMVTAGIRWLCGRAPLRFGTAELIRPFRDFPIQKIANLPMQLRDGVDCQPPPPPPTFHPSFSNSGSTNRAPKAQTARLGI